MTPGCRATLNLWLTRGFRQYGLLRNKSHIAEIADPVRTAPEPVLPW
jgi:hypothetical protein